MIKLQPELVEDGVEDERAPADEEDGGDAAEEDVSSPTTLIHLRMLAGWPGNDVIITMVILLSENDSSLTDFFTLFI